MLNDLPFFVKLEQLQKTKKLNDEEKSLQGAKNRERFTDDSLLYQKILSFSLLGTAHQSFARWKICKWLKDNHRPFEKRSVDSLLQLAGRKIES